MAKKAKGNRVQVILECTEHKDSGMPGTSRYITTKNRKNTTLTLGIVGLVFSVLLPIVTYCCSIPGLVMAGQNPYTGERDTVGKVLNIVAICVAALNSLAAVISNLVR